MAGSLENRGKLRELIDKFQFVTWLVREKNRKLWEEKSNEFETIATGENSG